MDPRARRGNTIRSNSIATATASHGATRRNATGDETTWGKMPGANCTGAERPPTWHDGREVDNRHLTWSKRDVPGGEGGSGCPSAIRDDSYILTAMDALPGAAS